MAEASDSVVELMQLRHVELKDLCRELSLPVSGTKLTLAVRIRNFYDKPEGNTQSVAYPARGDVSPKHVHEEIQSLELQISKLERKIKISLLEREISELYEKHVGVKGHSTPRCDQTGNVHDSQAISDKVSPIVVAKSNEPFVTYNRHRGLAAMSDEMQPTILGIPSSHTANSAATQQKAASQSNILPTNADIESSNPILAYHLQASKLPRCEPTIFSGDILRYNDWNKSFSQFIDKNPTLTPGEKLSYLARYTGGDVRRVVEGYTSLDDENSYALVRGIIQRRYGHPQKIAQAFQRRLYDWPPISSNDPIALQKFSDFLINCRAAQRTIPDLSFLNHPQENKRLKQLLPAWLKRKWNSAAVDYSVEHDDSFPPFDVFVDFVFRQSEKLNHPIAADGDISKPASKAKTQAVSLNASLSNASVSPKVSSATAKSGSGLTAQCISCKGDHKLYKCDLFKALCAADKLAFVQKHNRCTTCFNESHGRNTPCTFRLLCKHCGKRGTGHNEALHDVLCSTREVPRPTTTNHDTQVTPASSLTCHVTNSSTSFILPVYVSHESQPDVESLTYAMIDTQSQVTFITDSLAQTITEPTSAVCLPLSTMSARSESSERNVYDGLRIRGFDPQSKRFSMRRAYGCHSIPNNLKVPTKFELQQWSNLHEVADKFPPVLNCDVGLLIGHDHHFAAYPTQTVPSRPPDDIDEPFAVCTPLGWTMVGPVSALSDHTPLNSYYSHNTVMCLEVPDLLHVKSEATRSHAYQITVNDSALINSDAAPTTMDVVRSLEKGFDMPGDADHALTSLDDCEFIRILSEGIQQGEDSLYSMPLPFRGGLHPNLPDNRPQALSRLKSLNHRFNDHNVYVRYHKFMSDLVANGDAEPVPIYQLHASNKWYLPHHSVFNPKHPNKFRVVFDASCSFKGRSLNSELLTGPDLNNNLIGVLTRFRERKIAIVCDIERMFYRFSVDSNCRDFLRFLWYDEQHNVKEYRMTKHVFGAASSPGCAKFGLLQIAKDHGKPYELARWFLEHCFYVDDGLYSCNSIDEAIRLLSDTRTIGECAGLHVHKIMSNSPDVLHAFPPSDLACDLKLFIGGISGTERALGLDWDPHADCFTFSHSTQFDKVTRRNMLKCLSSLFDPLGFLSPFVLCGKNLLQRACHGIDWDEHLPQSLSDQWKAWLEELPSLAEVRIPRCLNITPQVARCEVHTYADASQNGYGVGCYLRLFAEQEVNVSLLFGKSRVAPLKGMTIPRLELQAAVLAAKVGSQLSSELSISIDDQYYWSDSQIVLAYIRNTRMKLRQYVRNRVVLIHELTKVLSWNYIGSEDNPADIASRGCSSVRSLLESIWFKGAPDLNDVSFSAPCIHETVSLDGDPEVVCDPVSSHCTSGADTGLLTLLNDASSYSAAIRIVDILLHAKTTRWKKGYQSSVNSLLKAESYLVKEVQSAYYAAELQSLRAGQGVAKSSSLVHLDPFIDQEGVIRVGGRIKFAELLEKERHPIIIPKNSFLSKLIISHYHALCAHQGRGLTISYIRSAGFWIVNITSAVASLIHHCIDCRKLRRPTEGQKMADLPVERVNPSPPFSYVGMDCFGPFEVKDKRRLVKRYGVIFTCLYSRAVHVEVADDLTSDSFILCLRTLFSLRGPVRQLHCDRGSNFIGANNELTRLLRNMPAGKLKELLEESRCEFVFNSPASSHMGGVWERQIRSFRNVLNGVALHASFLDVTSMRTVFYECMNIMNSRPLTSIYAGSLEPLTPNHLLHMKSSLVLPPPPGTFDTSEQYSRKRWKRVQSAVDLFWSRWRAEYLANLQSRPCWTKVKGFNVGDIVLLKEDDLARAQWKMCRVTELYHSHDGLVRKVKLRVGDRTGGTSIGVSYLERPVHKLVLLIPVGE